jgi:hypothetical protein
MARKTGERTTSANPRTCAGAASGIEAKRERPHDVRREHRRSTRPAIDPHPCDEAEDGERADGRPAASLRPAQSGSSPGRLSRFATPSYDRGGDGETVACPPPRGTRTMNDRTLSASSFSHVINAPIERVDIADWLFNLPEAEYQRCCVPDHIAAGVTTTDEGRRMSINVETIGQTLVIQHYVGEITEKHLCRMVSQSDVITPNGRTKVQVVWELSVAPIDAQRCEYTNRVTASATDEFLAFIAEHGIAFEDARAARQEASSNHNSRETPLFAQSIERRALA